ncbi:MAG TPA: monovalent cation/H+ antiporter complex subunit F [Vulgatibacter sp.]
MNVHFLEAGILALGVLSVPTLYVVARNADIATQVLAVDLLGVLLCGFVALVSYLAGSVHYLDTALVLALLSFAGTLSSARAISTGSILGGEEEQ